jgi:hypothetical protein
MAFLGLASGWALGGTMCVAMGKAIAVQTVSPWSGVRLAVGRGWPETQGPLEGPYVRSVRGHDLIQQPPSRRGRRLAEEQASFVEII